ncbi:MAG: DinB family protein [Ginsengibacter sp.]
MQNNSLNTESLFESLQYTTKEFLKLVSSFDVVKINSIPFINSWTAAQLADHVTKSNKAIIQAMGMQGTKAQRNAGERIQELKDIFLNYQIKFQSPGFIKPTQQIYVKKILVDDLQTSIERFKVAAGNADFMEIISLPAFGTITKLELAWFVLYHTQRHLHQLKKIFISLENKHHFSKKTSRKSSGT